jgi:hypothetical protein
MIDSGILLLYPGVGSAARLVAAKSPIDKKATAANTAM